MGCTVCVLVEGVCLVILIGLVCEEFGPGFWWTSPHRMRSIAIMRECLCILCVNCFLILRLYLSVIRILVC